MNYYKHHIGDYAGATEHLSWDEDMAYARLLRIYYRDERPVPADLAKTYRLVRAITPAQRRAVDTVLKEFFSLEPDGWHQTRCDEELAAATEKADTNRRVGKLGGRPRKSQTQTVIETKPTKNPDGSYAETVTVISGNPNETLATSHKPLATNQEERAERARGTRLPADWAPPPEWRTAAEQARRDAKLPPCNLDLEAASFRDFWIAKPGKDGVKLDWRATWLNWARRANSRPAQGNLPMNGQPARPVAAAPGGVTGGSREDIEMQVHMGVMTQAEGAEALAKLARKAAP